MSRNALRILLSFAFVLQIAAFSLFYFVAPQEEGFLPLCLTLLVCLIVTVLALLSYRKRAIEEDQPICVWPFFFSYLGVFATLIIIRLIIIAVS